MNNLHVTIYAGGMPFDAHTIPDGKSLGGSETAAYEMGRELARLGHSVTVFTSKQDAKGGEGVTYQWHGQPSQQYPMGEYFARFAVVPHDVCIIQRHPAAFASLPINSKINILWLHDLALKRNDGHISASLLNIDRVITVSEFHKQQVCETWNIAPSHVFATHNGVDYSMFSNLPLTREPRSLIFTSRPERGLEALVCKGGVMERLTDCHLYVCNYDNTTPDMKAYYQHLYDRCAALPNVTVLGHLGKRDLYRAIAKCELQVYPTSFEDTSCIAALEAMGAGTPWVSFKTGALPETCKGGGTVLLDFKEEADPRARIISERDIEIFAHNVKAILGNKQQLDALRRKCAEKRQDWASAAIDWNDEIARIFAKKTDHPLKVFKHLEAMSDVAALVSTEQGREIVDALPGDIREQFNANYAFYINNAFAEHYKAYYEYEHDVKGVEYGPEDVSQQARFRATLQLINGFKPTTIMDYGCAHGHYTMNLANNMPNAKLTGYDIAESNIEIARKWAVDAGMTDRVEFQHGTHETVEGEYDMILACEVLEHSPDPVAIVAELKKHLAPNGTMLVSVPYGPWEGEGYYWPENIGWRAHIHHFERADISDIFGSQRDMQCVALAATPTLGHWLITFRNSDAELGTIDYERKLATQSPQETLSVCLIVKDGENTLGKCLSKIGRMADEIIIGLDKTTTDDTRRIAEKYGAKIIDIESPTRQGFDNARNKTIAEATCDWIMWVDDDESIENIDALGKYLRHNQYLGYAIPQHHISAEPPSLFQTDYPIRVFRNHHGIKFFGHVHEHPELGLNEGMGKVIALHDVSILHTGYSLESIRRGRFNRNWPLMQIDRQRHPERTLGKFLWARDLSHIIRYQMEQNGGVVTDEIVHMAQDIVNTWRHLVSMNEVRMASDCLSFYSHAVSIMGGGIEYAVNLEAAISNVTLNGGAKHGRFASREDIEAFTNMLIRDKTGVYESKYF